MLTLYHSPQSRSDTVVHLVRMLGADADIREVTIRRQDGSGAPDPDNPHPEKKVPYLVDGDFCIAQVAHILAWAGEKHGFGAGDQAGDLQLIMLQLTISDIVAEAHNVHHPIAGDLYYEDQKDAAARAAENFREQRIPKFFRYFKDALSASDGPFVLGDRWSHVDTSLFQLIEGLRYAFPKRMKAIEGDYPKLIACRDAVAELDGIKDYLASERRLAFNEDGIFRHYPELDAA